MAFSRPALGVPVFPAMSSPLPAAVSPSPVGLAIPAPLRDWLASINLSIYADKLVANGYDDLEIMAVMSDEEVKAMIDTIQALPGHKIKLQHKIRELKAQLSSCKEEGNAAQGVNLPQATSHKVQGERQKEEKKQEQLQGEQPEQQGQKSIVEQVKELSRANLPPPGSSTAQILFHYIQLVIKQTASKGITDTPIVIHVNTGAADKIRFDYDPNMTVTFGDRQTVLHVHLAQPEYGWDRCSELGQVDHKCMHVLEVSKDCSLEFRTPRVFKEFVNLFSANRLRFCVFTCYQELVQRNNGYKPDEYRDVVAITKPCEMKEREVEAWWMESYKENQNMKLVVSV